MAVGRRDDAAFAVAFGIDTQHCLAVFEQHGRRMAKVLALFVINNDLTIELIVEIDVGNRIRKIACKCDAGPKQKGCKDGCE